MSLHRARAEQCLKMLVIKPCSEKVTAGNAFIIVSFCYAHMLSAEVLTGVYSVQLHLCGEWPLLPPGGQVMYGAPGLNE